MSTFITKKILAPTYPPQKSLMVLKICVTLEKIPFQECVDTVLKAKLCKEGFTAIQLNTLHHFQHRVWQVDEEYSAGEWQGSIHAGWGNGGCTDNKRHIQMILVPLGWCAHFYREGIVWGEPEAEHHVAQAKKNKS